MIAVARRYFFHARHHVEALGAPWNEDHWHRYTVEVVAEAQAPADSGVVIDTDRLDEVWEVHKGGFHNQNLNDTTETDTTVEALSALILGYFPEEVREVTVWEDHTRWGRARR